MSKYKPFNDLSFSKKYFQCLYFKFESSYKQLIVTEFKYYLRIWLTRTDRLFKCLNKSRNIIHRNDSMVLRVFSLKSGLGHSWFIGILLFLWSNESVGFWTAVRTWSETGLGLVSDLPKPSNSPFPKHERLKNLSIPEKPQPTWLLHFLSPFEFPSVRVMWPTVTNNSSRL